MYVCTNVRTYCAWFSYSSATAADNVKIIILLKLGVRIGPGYCPVGGSCELGMNFGSIRGRESLDQHNDSWLLHKTCAFLLCVTTLSVTQVRPVHFYSV